MTKPTNEDKWRYTLYTTVVFLLVVHPQTYRLVNYLLGKIVKISDKCGCPTMSGIIVHAIVFTLIVRYMMDIKGL
jgi:hypothetical protein